MKHISQTPAVPSSVRSDIPHDVDMVVTRALAKDPADRYQSAEEMDADLERVARGSAIARETEESATQILAAPTTVMSATAASTMVQRRAHAPGPPPPPVYYDYEEPMRRRPLWPWLLALAFVIAAGIGGYFLYHQISNKIGSNGGVAVDNYQGMTAQQAEAKVHSAGLGYHLSSKDSSPAEIGIVVDQNPSPGVRIEKGKNVTLFIGRGPPKTDVPNIIGKSESDADSALADAHLKWKGLQVPSDKPAGTVLAQDPKAGSKQVQGTIVNYTVSKGPQPVAVPNVVGMSSDSANSTLQAAGFSVSSKAVKSDQPAGTVVDQSPAANSSSAKGSTVTISISKGPTTTGVPDVTSQDQQSATQALQAAGFKVRVVQQDTLDPTLDGIVMNEDPQPNTQAKPGSTVTITVGHAVTPTDTGTVPTTTNP
jgi:serine/threonine-protein kinase